MAYFCAVSAKQKLIQNIEISVIRKNFSSAQRNLFFDSVCGLSGQFVDSTVLILKSEVCRTAFSQNRSWLKSFFCREHICSAQKSEVSEVFLL